MPGSNFCRVTRETLGPLYDLAFPNTHGVIEGSYDRVMGIVSDAALKWAKSQQSASVLA